MSPLARSATRAAFFTLGAVLALSQPPPPNLVFILTDDMCVRASAWFFRTGAAP
jgi:hypothetical protein